MRDRLAGTAAESDPARVSVGRDAHRWPAELRRQLRGPLTPAGVLIPIVDRPEALSVLLTRRAEGLPQHAGQVSFPGGRMEPGDADICATALRETHEEIGLSPEQVDVAGFLAPMPTITGYAVTPVVGLVGPDLELVPDPVEVDLIFEVPLDFLMDPANRRQGQRELYGVMVPIVEYRYGDQRIWGATASMVVALAESLFV